MVTKAKENLVFSMAGLPIQKRIALSYAKEEFVWKCSFNGAQCNISKDFRLHVGQLASAVGTGHRSGPV